MLAGRSPVDENDAYRLRLCLDLQLHALLLTIGAAAADNAAPGAPSRDSGPDAPSPWLRWIAQDVDQTCAIATATLNGGAALPTPLGSDLHRSVPATTVDSLLALYRSMSAQLAHLTSARSTWQDQVYQALERCQFRVAELESYRLATDPPRRISLPQAEHHFLPGELLG